MFKNAKWIWKSKEIGKDEYVAFTFDIDYSGEKALLRLSADSDYNLFVNGKLISFGQYHNYEENTVYDEIVLTESLKKGKNHIEILVWYYGETNFSYSVGQAGLIFELLLDGKAVLWSNENILSAYEPHYVQGYSKNITWQLGYGYRYDFTVDKELEFTKSVVVERAYPIAPCPVKKLLLGAPIDGRLYRNDSKKKYIFDFKKETVGFLQFTLDSEAESEVTISYGEHLLNDEICRIIEHRDFSFSYRVKKGENTLCNAFRRLGCRYIAIESEKPFEVKEIQLLPTDYPLTEVSFNAGDSLRQAIYDTSIRTLKMCMHEHYEDCPWREQGLYTMDSRNQMLCGYYAFKEYDFAKASLALFANARKCGGLLPICAPCDHEQTIPSFGLHYFTQVREYLEYSHDKSFLESIYEKLVDLLGTFNERVHGGLLLEFEGPTYWNFYEWKEGLAGDGPNKYHLVLNTLYLRALQSMATIANVLHKEDVFTERANALKENIYQYFYDKKQGLFILGKENPIITELGNYLCVITGVVTGDQAKAVVEALRQNKERVTLTLSMLCFAYDALLLIDKEFYKEEILADIDKRWKKMLDAGATTFWETEEGYKDFNGAGSLCHGWSAIPIYYYNILLGN